ncbi:MAG: neutral/alkaline non-lysosomal ceramidase N-terminal domain-containing protein [Fimbriimonadaceae bacterium]|nr:neutral/alkaline non-lysosomal ceramidase N-terminal domain-containing protein [Fimbriimonadaceae bacterium]
MSAPLLAGFAVADLTPPLGCRLYGYPVADRVAESIHDPLYARALVFAQGDTQAVWVELDWCMVDHLSTASLQLAIAARCGIPADHVTLCAIQTHSGPATQTANGWGERDAAYLAWAEPRVVDAVAAAVAALQPVTVGLGSIASDVGINRRGIREDHTVGLGYHPWGPYDPTMTVVRVVGASGPVVTLVHYGAHPTAQGPVRFVSRDWPGVLLDRVEALTGAPAMFINGAVGDVGPRLACRATTGDGAAASEEVGLRAASHAMQAYHSIREFRPLELAVAAADLPLPYAPLPDLATAERELAAAASRRDEWGAGACNYRYWQAVIAAQGQPVPAGRPYRQSLTQLGPLALVPLPGEPFAAIVLRLRDGSPYQHTLVASTSNGAYGYFATREARARGGYEVWVARAFGAWLPSETIDDYLVQENLRLLRALAAGG